MMKIKEDVKMKIEMLRMKLAESATVKGYNHQDTIIISQKLDKILNDYERYFKK